MKLTSIEICAGAGGQAIGLEMAGFDHSCLVEIDSDACQTLRQNRPSWNVFEGSVKDFSGLSYSSVDLLAGGVPCPPFSIAGKQLGADDERDLFPEVIRLAKEINPSAIMIENVRGLLSAKFEPYRVEILRKLRRLGYVGEWRLLNAADFGVPQNRYRSILVALKNDFWSDFTWPIGISSSRKTTVGEALLPFMSQKGWKGAKEWARGANDVGPTIVGGSKKHGGPDLGPTRARNAWLELGVNGKSIGNEPPEKDFEGTPKLTVEMAAAVQGFPGDWQFFGRKTTAYRQVGNAFPPPVANAVGLAIKKALLAQNFKIDLSQFRFEKRDLELTLV